MSCPLLASGTEMAATTVNPVDLQTRTDKVIAAKVARFPMILGWDVAGTTDQIGEGVDGWGVGERVAAPPHGPHGWLHGGRVRSWPHIE